MLVSASGFIRFSPHIRQAPPTRRFPGLLSNRILQLAASASLIAASVAPPLALAHVGHGDEFQPQGEARQVQRNADSDALLGVTTARPQPGADGLSVPATAVVDAAGKPLLFVQTATTYDPVYVVTGGDQGDRVVVREGLDPEDDVVTSGALSLYAESLKTQKPEPKAAPTKTAASAALPLPLLAAGGVVLLAGGGIWLSRRRQTNA